MTENTDGKDKQRELIQDKPDRYLKSTSEPSIK